MAKFMLILQEGPAVWNDFTPEQMKAALEKYMAWGMRMRESGRMVGGNKLKDEAGKVLRKDGKKLKVVDGPYAESREVIGGFYIVEADSYAHCIELIQDHPHLEYGQTIAVREIDPVPEE